MSATVFSSSQTRSDVELEEFERLAVTLSSRLTRLHLEDIAPAIGSALDQVAGAMSGDSCRLIEFAEGGAVAREHFPTRIGNAQENQVLASARWLIERLARGELVA